jgi:hypothetical protein
MKKVLLSSMMAAFALASLEATATPLPTPFRGPITISWTILTTNANDYDKPVFPDGGKKTVTGKGENKATNIFQIFSYASESYAFNNTTLLDLLSNSLQTTFPAGTHLIWGPGDLVVVDSTGTNQIVSDEDLASILTVSNGDTVITGSKSVTTNTTSLATTISTTGGGSGTQGIAIKYDDSAVAGLDAYSTFKFLGRSSLQSSSAETEIVGKKITDTIADQFLITGYGYGKILGKPAIISGTIKGSLSGSETISLVIP